MGLHVYGIACDWHLTSLALTLMIVHLLWPLSKALWKLYEKIVFMEHNSWSWYLIIMKCPMHVGSKHRRELWQLQRPTLHTRFVESGGHVPHATGSYVYDVYYSVFSLKCHFSVPIAEYRLYAIEVRRIDKDSAAARLGPQPLHFLPTSDVDKTNVLKIKLLLTSQPPFFIQLPNSLFARVVPDRE